MQAETGVYSTFLSVFCFCYPVWNMIYPIYHVLLFSIFSQLRMTSHPFIPPVASPPISNSNMPLPGSRQTRFLEQSKKILNTINLINLWTTSSHLPQTIQWLSNERELHHIKHTLIAYPLKSSKALEVVETFHRTSHKQYSDYRRDENGIKHTLVAYPFKVIEESRVWYCYEQLQWNVISTMVVMMDTKYEII